MKLKGAKQVHYESGPNMTPLVDVVMVILIFLMLAGSFGSAEHFMLSSTPINKNAGGDPKSTPDKTQPFTIRVDSDGSRFVANVEDTPCTDETTLSQTLKAKQAGLLANGTKMDDIQVIIDPGTEVQYKYLIEVYQAALDAQFTKVAFIQPH